jgi:hypothetical protein
MKKVGFDFNRTGVLTNDANLMTVSDEQGRRAEIKRVVDILEEGEWITEGIWGAYERWTMGDSGEEVSEEEELWRL